MSSEIHASLVRERESVDKPRWLDDARRRAPAALVLMLVIVLPVLFVSRGTNSEWNDCFVTAAHHMAAREAIHHTNESYAYPPSMTFVSLPIGVLPLPWSLFAWSLVNIAATIATFYYSWKLIGGPALAKASATWWGVFGLGLLLCFRWIISPLEHQQFDMVIAALITAGGWAVASGKNVRGGLLWGVAASMKCTPLLFAPYLAWRGRWLAAVLVVVAAVGMNVLPDLVVPQASGRSYVADWYRMFLKDVGSAAPGTWHSDLTLNQSLGGLFNRWARVGWPWSVENLEQTALPADAARQLKLLTYGAALLLVGATAWIGGRPFRGPQANTGETPGRQTNLIWAAEIGAVACLMLLLSPMSSKAHYVVLWLPSLLVARLAIERPSATWRVLVVLLAITGTLTTKGMVGKNLGDLTLTWGFPTFFAILMLVAMWGGMRDRRDAGLKMVTT